MADMVVDPQGVRANRRQITTGPGAAGHKLLAVMGSLTAFPITASSSEAAMARLPPIIPRNAAAEEEVATTVAAAARTATVAANPALEVVVLVILTLHMRYS
jgi:hypothetical protein